MSSASISSRKFRAPRPPVRSSARPAVANSAFPDLGVPYGVFGGRSLALSGWGIDRGKVKLSMRVVDQQTGADLSQQAEAKAAS